VCQAAPQPARRVCSCLPPPKNHTHTHTHPAPGVGYSVAASRAHIPADMEGMASDLYAGLWAFMDAQPHLQQRPLFITGESFAGVEWRGWWGAVWAETGPGAGWHTLLMRCSQLTLGNCCPLPACRPLRAESGTLHSAAGE
jgi:hypothetical protein